VAAIAATAKLQVVNKGIRGHGQDRGLFAFPNQPITGIISAEGITMKTLKLSAIAAVLLLGASLSLVTFAQPASSKRTGPDTLVADLYQANKQKRSPFFQTRSRALLYKYFEKTLADLIWKDAVHSKGEVGAIDGDPLYDAQDMEIRKFAIKKPRYEEGRALVDATFENFGKPQTITFIVVKGKTGWRIRDIVYSEGRTLGSELKESR